MTSAKPHDDSPSASWLAARRDPDTDIECLRADFTGHAYDPHDHDDMLVGYTEQGVQRFRCHRAVHTSMPGRAIPIEPGALHDGYAPEATGFTYSMLYLPQTWVERSARRLELPGRFGMEAAFGQTLVDDAALVDTIRRPFLAIYGNEGRLARVNASAPRSPRPHLRPCHRNCTAPSPAARLRRARKTPFDTCPPDARRRTGERSRPARSARRT
jgi:hypothetical protein